MNCDFNDDGPMGVMIDCNLNGMIIIQKTFQHSFIPINEGISVLG